MNNQIVRNTFNILLLNIFFHIVVLVIYFSFAFLCFIDIIPFFIINIYNVLNLIVLAVLKVFVFNLYGCYTKYYNRWQLVVPLIINFVVITACELIALAIGRFDDIFYWHMGINPITAFDSGLICDLVSQEEFKIPITVSMIIIENIIYLAALYFGAKKKNEPKTEEEFEKVYYTDDNIVITIKYVEDLAYIVAEKIFTEEVIVKETLDTDGIKITDFDVQVSDNKILVKYAKGNDCKEIVEEFVMKE